MLSDLNELLSIESVMSEKSDNAPFGKPLRKTLDWFLAKAKSYGLKACDLDGYCGYAEYGDGEQMISFLCHLDVVPAGGGWTYPPYALTVEEGYLYGRGVVDNKGSAVTALHILKKLKEKNVKLKNRIRLIVGLNEENGSNCIKHYKECAEIPKMSIVPDSDFPIINSEKGILHLLVSIPADPLFIESVHKFDAGSRANVVPDNAKITIKKGSPLYEKLKSNACGNDFSAIFSSPELAKIIVGESNKIKDYSCNVFEDSLVIETRGISGHAMCPDRADNAIHKIFALLKGVGSPTSGETSALINELFCSPLSPQRLGLDKKDDKSGELTMSLGIIKYESNIINLTLDFRLPLCVPHTDVVQKIKAKLPHNAKVEILHNAKNLYIEESDPMIQTLLKVYHNKTGLPPYTVQTGGGTYARELPHSVAFGPTFPGTVTNIHNADERISIEQFEKLYDIYYEAALELDKL